MSARDWWLAVEPLDDAVAWALTCADGSAVTGPVDAGLWTGLGGIAESAARARPTGAGDLWSGPLTAPDEERELAVRVGAALLPEALRAALLAGERDRPETVTVAARGWLAAVPWDGLALDAEGTRLVERARVLGGLPATVHVGRARRPDLAADGPALRVVDPGPSSPTEGDGASWQLVYPLGRPAEWNDVLRDDEFVEPADGDGLGVAEFGALLHHGSPGRLLYFGHAVSGTVAAPAAAALVLTDDRGDARLFTAFDWLADPAGFPAPPRVAVIGCGSDDSGIAEQSGLPIAAINAGAGLVTATRWVLPLDPRPDLRPATALALAVDRAHAAPDPVGALRRWQLDRLDRWRAHGELLDTPLMWASLVTYLAAGRP